MTQPEYQTWQDVLDLLQAKQDQQPQLLAFLLSVLLTSDERDSVLARVNIIHQLLKGDLSQRQISQMLGVGIATITRGSSELKNLSDEQKQQLHVLLDDVITLR